MSYLRKTGLLLSVLVFTTMLPYTAFADDYSYHDSIDPDKPMIALTFDDGPSALYTADILDILEEYNAHATFYVLGTEAKKNEDLLVRMLKNGNEIGSHTLNHQDLTSLTEEEVLYQMETTNRTIEDATGTLPKTMRAPYGYMNDETANLLEYPIVLWSLDTLDWESRDADSICETLLENVKDGDIVLMHDIYGSTAEAIQTLVPELIERGYQLVTVSELSQYRSAEMQQGTIYNNFYPSADIIKEDSDQ